MTELQDYQDARTLHPEYQQSLCPACGVTRWFKKRHPSNDREYWYCQDCNNHRDHTIEYPCPDCDVRMLWVMGRFECRNETCSHETTDTDKEALIDRLSGPHHTVQGMPGINLQCPVCGEREAGGDPDGDIICNNCLFHAGQYSAQWYCYAVWKENPEVIRVNDFE